MPSLTETSNPSLSGWGQYLSTSYIPDPSSPEAIDFLTRLRKYDPSARYVPMDAEHGGGAQIVFDVTKLPKTASGEAFNPSAFMETSMPGFNTGGIIDPSKVMKGDPTYGDYTAGANTSDPDRTNWIDVVGPLAVGAFAGLGAGGFLPGAGAEAAGAGSSPLFTGGGGVGSLFTPETGSLGAELLGGSGPAVGLEGVGGSSLGLTAPTMGTAAGGITNLFGPPSTGGLGAADLAGAAAGGGVPTGAPTPAGTTTPPPSTTTTPSSFSISDIAKGLGLTTPQFISMLLTAGGGLFNYLNTGKAADKVLAGINNSNNDLKTMFGQGADLFKPYSAAGLTALDKLTNAPPSNLAANFKPLGSGAAIVGGKGRR